MPLLPGKKNIGHNISVEEKAGKPKKQAVAIALSKAEGKDAVNKADLKKYIDFLDTVHGGSATKVKALVDKFSIDEGLAEDVVSFWIAGGSVTDTLDPAPIALSKAEGRDVSKQDEACKLFKAGKTIVDISQRLAVPENIVERWVGFTRAPGTLFGRTKDAQEDGPVEAYGVRGMKSSPWRKTFKSQKDFEKWLDKNEGDVEVQGTRKAEDSCEDPAPIPVEGEDRVLGRGAVGDASEKEYLAELKEMYGDRDPRYLNERKRLRERSAPVIAERKAMYGEKDPRVRRPVDSQGDPTPIPTNDDVKYATPPSKPRFIGSVALPNKEDVDRVYGGKRSDEGFKRTFGKDGTPVFCDKCGSEVSPFTASTSTGKILCRKCIAASRSAKDADPAPVRVTNPLPHVKTVPVSKKPAKDREQDIDEEKSFDLGYEDGERGRKENPNPDWTGWLKKAYGKGYEAGRAKAKDAGVRRMAQDAFRGRNIARGPGESAQANDAAARAYDYSLPPYNEEQAKASTEGLKQELTRLKAIKFPDHRQVEKIADLERFLKQHEAYDAVAHDTIDPKTVSRVYSGRPGCMCGCRGNYSTSPATIAQICKKIDAIGDRGNSDWATAETPTRSYTAYYKSGKYAKDVRPAHDSLHGVAGMAAKAKAGRAKDIKTFSEAKCPQCGQIIPVTYADGALYFIGHSKKGEPFKCPGSHRLAGKAGTADALPLPVAV